MARDGGGAHKMQFDPATSAAASPVRVLIVDQDPLVRRVVRDALTGDGIAIVAEAGDGPEAVVLASMHRPDVVLMDIVLPAFDGVPTIRRIISAPPLVRVIVFTGGRD